MKPTPGVAASIAYLTALAWCLQAGATISDYQQAITNESSLISYYTFDRTNAADSFGANTGSVSGTAKFGDGIGSAGRGLLLDGAGRVNLGVVPAFDFADGTGSVEAWVRPGWAGNLTAYNPCIFADRDGGPVTWSVHMNGDKSGVGVWNGFSYLPIAIPAPGTNWHHLVVTFDNSSSLALVAVYWDGVFVGDRNQDVGTGSNPTQLGSSAASVTDEGWVGSLDEVAFYANALSSNAIQAHYQALFIGTPPVIATQPRGGTFLPGVRLQLNVGATGPNLSYQWFKNGSLMSGATDSVLTFTNLQNTDAATYHVVVSNPATNVQSADAGVALSTTLPAQLISYQTAITNEPSLISYYTFDRLSPNDVLGRHPGTMQGSAGFGSGMGGVPGQEVLLDGGGHVSLGAVPDFDFTNTTGTVEAWIRADWSGLGYNPCTFADRNGGTVNWSIHMNSDKNAVGLWNGTAYQTFAIPNAGTNWHHLAVVFDSGTFTGYWDGASLGTVTQGLGGTPATVQLGSSADSPTAEGWVGMLDEVAFYSNALTAASIQTHYSAFFGTAAPTITLQPVGGDFYPGGVAQLSVGAMGAGLSYQWFKNGTAIVDGTNWFLAFASLGTNDAGAYYVHVSNAGGGINSATALLQVGNYLSQYRAAVLAEPSLISYYTFDSSNAMDSKGTNSGSLTGNPTFNTGVGQGTDQALVLDGSSDIDLGAVPAFDFTNGIGTVEAWLRPDWTSDPGYDPCLFADRNGGPTDWSLHMLRTRGGIGNWNGSHFQSLPLSNTTGWHHYAVVFNAGEVSMYWDGQALGTFGQAINLSPGQSVQIGSSAPLTTAEGWIGAVDEVAFYAAALGANNIEDHFLAMVGAPQAPALSVLKVNNTVLLSWPANASGFTLQYADTLPAASWTTVTGLTSNQATFALTNNQRFYRLKK